MAGPRYRRVGGASNVDESLFGGEGENGRKFSGSNKFSLSAASKRSTSRRIDPKEMMSSAIVLSMSELEHIKVFLFAYVY